MESGTGGPSASESPVPAAPAAPQEPVAVPSPAAPGVPPVAAGVDWAASIPPEYAKDKVWEGLKGKPLADVLKEHANAQRHLGSAIRMPGKDATPEQVATWQQETLGKLAAAGLIETPPPKAEDYQIERPPIVAELGWSDAREATFKTTAHALGLTQGQVQGLVEWQAKDLAGTVQAGQAALETATATLQDEWGANFDVKMGRAEQVVNTYFDAPTKAALKASGLNNVPGFIKGLVTLGSRMAEHGDLPGTLEGQPTPQQLDEQIAALREQSRTTPFPAERIKISEQIHALYQQKLGDANRVHMKVG